MKLRDLLDDEEEECISEVSNTPNEENLTIKQEHNPQIEQIFIWTRNDESELESEQTLRNPQRKVDQEEIFCEFCEKGFKSRNNYSSHLLTHSDERNFCCEICGKRSKTISDLKKHKKTHLKKEETSQNCENQMKTHSGKTRLKCKICEMEFSHRSSLHRHHLAHTRKRKFTCEICQKSYARKEYLNKHYKTCWEKI